MRKYPFYLIASLIFLYSCKKTNDSNIQPTACSGLVTDTAGTNDMARIYMPNAFTPNGDGLNDISRPVYYHIASTVFTIFDENNIIVFTTDQLNQGWTPVSVSNTAKKYRYKIQAVTSGNHRIGLCGDLYYLTCLPAPTLPATIFLYEDQVTINGFTGPTLEVLLSCN